LNDRTVSESEKRALDYIRSEIHEIEGHLVGTRDLALEINRDQSLGFDEEKVILAALCHDLARLHDPEIMKRELLERGIDPDSLNCQAPILLHAALSAELARERIGIQDPEILDAIRRHATGTADMTLFDKLIYVSDKVERGRSFDGVDELRTKAVTDLVSAFPEVIAAVIRWVVARNEPLDYNSVAAYNRTLNDLDRSGNRNGNIK